MQIEEVKEKKFQLERNILLTIKKFQDETGLIISKLELDTETEKISPGHKQVTGQKVSVIIKI
ncbi:MAG: hypothetical protein ABI760_21935 [Ferruginibacter sp.]